MKVRFAANGERAGGRETKVLRSPSATLDKKFLLGLAQDDAKREISCGTAESRALPETSAEGVAGEFEHRLKE